MPTLFVSLTSACGSSPFWRSAASRKRSGVLPGLKPRISLPLSIFQSNLSTFSRPTSMKPSVEVSPHLVVANLHPRLGLGEGGRRSRGGEERRKTSLQRAAAIEHGGHQIEMRTGNRNLTPDRRKTPPTLGAGAKLPLVARASRSYRRGRVIVPP